MEDKNQIHYDIAELLEKIAHLNIKLAGTDKIHPVELDLLRNYLRELDKLADALPLIQLPKPSFPPQRPAAESPSLFHLGFREETGQPQPAENLPKTVEAEPTESEGIKEEEAPVASWDFAPEASVREVPFEHSETLHEPEPDLESQEIVMETVEEAELEPETEPVFELEQEPEVEPEPETEPEPEMASEVESEFHSEPEVEAVEPFEEGQAEEPLAEEDAFSFASEPVLENPPAEEEPVAQWSGEETVQAEQNEPTEEEVLPIEPPEETLEAAHEDFPLATDVKTPRDEEPQQTGQPEWTAYPPALEEPVFDKVEETVAEEPPVEEVVEEALNGAEESFPLSTDVKAQREEPAPQHEQPQAPQWPTDRQSPTETKRSLNDLFSRDTAVPHDAGSRFQFQTRRNLREMIDLSERYIFTKELFGGDADYYDRAIRQLNQFETLAEAQNYIVNELRARYKWEGKEQVERQFIKLVERRFA